MLGGQGGRAGTQALRGSVALEEIIKRTRGVKLCPCVRACPSTALLPRLPECVHVRVWPDPQLT